MSDVLGKFVWYDLLTPDPAKAVGFYTAVTGWGTSEWQAAEGAPPYVMWMAGETAIGGVGPLPAESAAAGVPPHWRSYIASDDCDATVAKAQELGGRVLEAPTDIPTVGRYAVLADPQGATFAVFTPAGDPPGHEGAPVPGVVSWNELGSNADEAWPFYSTLFGWEKTDAMDMGPDGRYQMFGWGETSIGGMYTLPEGAHWLPYVMVADLDGSIQTAVDLGATLVHGPAEVPGGRIAILTDPQGGTFAIHGE